MENYSMTHVSNELLNIERNSIITSLYQRDLIKNYFPQEQVIKYLKELNYYSIDIDKESKIYLINELNKLIMEELQTNFNSNIKTKTIDENLVSIKETNEYKIFISKLYNKIERAFKLSKHIVECNNILNFYNDLTLEELNQINY